MSQPMTIDVPHRLGKEGAKQRMRERIGDLGSHIPGGVADVRSSWPSDDVMALTIAAMNQTIEAKLEVEESRVRIHLMLPAMLGFFGSAISSAIAAGGAKMLEKK